MKFNFLDWSVIFVLYCTSLKSFLHSRYPLFKKFYSEIFAYLDNFFLHIIPWWKAARCFISSSPLLSLSIDMFAIIDNLLICLQLEEEMERMSQLDGLKNKEHVLNLCRLMVRAESNDHRLSILRILQVSTLFITDPPFLFKIEKETYI